MRAPSPAVLRIALCSAVTMAGTLACGEGEPVETVELGAPCIPDVEFDESFSGFDVDEISIQTGDLGCGGNFCLVHHFQGRVTCPYGQTADAIVSLPPDDPTRCRRLERRNAEEVAPDRGVLVPVLPQISGRPADESVFCSCRCAAREPDAPVCACPNGFECAPLFDDPSFQGTALGGSYCVPTDRLPPDGFDTPECDRTVAPGQPGDCGNGGANP